MAKNLTVRLPTSGQAQPSGFARTCDPTISTGRYQASMRVTAAARVGSSPTLNMVR
jgi:hypothetical protein